MQDPLWVCVSQSPSALLFPPQSPTGQSFPKSVILVLLGSGPLTDKIHVHLGQGRGGGWSSLWWNRWGLRPKGLHPFPQDERHSHCCRRRLVPHHPRPRPPRKLLPGGFCFLHSVWSVCNWSCTGRTSHCVPWAGGERRNSPHFPSLHEKAEADRWSQKSCFSMILWDEANILFPNT